jgi:Lysyl oxidase
MTTFRCHRTALLCSLLAAVFLANLSGAAQTAYVRESWWTYQQDCNGDGCQAGQLPGDLARINWTPVVNGCDGNLSVFEILYSKPHSSSTWTPIFTNAVHPISGCSIMNSVFYDVQMGSNCAVNDYRIDLYRQGQAKPDFIDSSTNDATLSQHHEQLLYQDICQDDFFATASALPGSSGTHADDNTYATKEPGEPNHAGNAGGKSLWYTWTAPTNTPVTFDTTGSSFDTLLSVYTGTVVSNLTLVASNDDINGAAERQSLVSFTPVTGTTYHIAVDGFGGASGIVNLNWNQSGALPDLIIWGPSVNPSTIQRTFAATDCEVVEGCEPVGTRTLLSFTTETRNIGAGDLNMGDPATNSLFIWAMCHQHWHFEQFASYSLLDANSNVVASGHKVGFCIEDVQAWTNTHPQAKYVCVSNPSTNINIHDNQGIQSGWADVYSAGLPCQYIDVTTVAPGQYTLQMIVNPDHVIPESDYDNDTTLVPVNIEPVTCTNTPVNDNFSNAVVVTNLPFNYTEFNNCATKQTGEPNHLGVASGHSVWFNWTPSSNQTIVINTKRSDFDTILAVYTGSTLSTLTAVATNDDIVNGYFIQSQVSFAAHAGTTYHIVVDGYNNSSGGPSVGTVVFNMQPPNNDDFTNAFPLAGTAGSVSGYNFNASKEPYEPSHAGDVGGHSIWFLWTAPTNGPVNFDTHGSDFATTLAVYTGGVRTNTTGGLGQFSNVVANIVDIEGGGAITSRVGFNATNGTTYKIAIDGFGGVSGLYQLNWWMNSALTSRQLPGGNVQVALQGVDWQRYLLYGSTNLHNWYTNHATITMSGGVHYYTNSPFTNPAPFEFYRAILTN